MTGPFMELGGTFGRNALSMTVRALSTHTHGWMKMAPMLSKPGVTILARFQEDILSKRPMIGAKQTKSAPGVITSRTALPSFIQWMIGELMKFVIPGVPQTAESWTRMDIATGKTLMMICEPSFLEAARLWTSLI